MLSLPRAGGLTRRGQEELEDWSSHLTAVKKENKGLKEQGTFLAAEIEQGKGDQEAQEECQA